MPKTSVLALAIFFGSITAACGGATPEPAPPPPPPAPSASAEVAAPAPPPVAAEPPPAPSASAAPAAPPLPMAWSDDLSKDQKKAFMKANVAPRMGKVFQERSAKKYGNFGCKTCHGPDWKAPKDFLPKLTLKGGKITAFAKKPDVAKFMAEKVVPEMASALGEPPYDPATKKGFGCMGCHTVVEAK